ncbi:MAG: ribonuclease R [Candidatus Pacebacteria bacterium]|nr:ribonuclease R [Candidatus Paceibacterota bacterium]
MPKPHRKGPSKNSRHAKKDHHSPTSKKTSGGHHPTRHKDTHSKSIEGTFIVLGKGGGIVKCEEYKDGIRVYEENVNMALHGDEVNVEVTGKRPARISGGAPETVGRISKIVLRTKTEFTGVLVEKNGKYFLKASDPKMYASIEIPKAKIGEAKHGDRVYVAMDSWKNARVNPEGSVIKVLGKPGEHETEMEAIALERGFTEDFQDEVLAEAKVIDARGITEQDLRDRRDFRKIVTFTIDPYDAKDFDDAISVEQLANGDTEIGIHIADVSHYVQLKTELDKEALERGTSVYLVDRTIPMLPRVLSDDLCSLLPNVDRLTMSTVVTFGADGVEKGAWFGPTVIHSAQRFTYESAQEVLDGAPHKYKEELMTAARIARGLGKLRAEEGALVLEQEEIKVLIDETGKPTKIVKKVRTESHTLIEELMLLANRRIAEFLERGGKNKKIQDSRSKNQEDDGHAVIYRTHDQPSPEKAEDLAFFMRSIGHPITLRKDGSIDPKTLIPVLAKLENGDLKQTVLTFVIRSMAKAIYTTKNIGHYGLQFKHYTHFTSPIRRYPDLVIHRLLRYALAGRPAPANMRKSYERIARLCSMAEIRAADAERESVKFKLTEYMATKVGQEITGMISGIAEWGMYVRDKETTAEGLVGMRTLPNEAWTLNPKLATLSGGTSGKVYRIGDTIKVRVVKADPERRQIDYELV